MGGSEEVFGLEDGGSGGRGFSFEHVEAGTGDLTALEGGGEVGFVDEFAASAVDDADPGLHFLEGGGVEHAVRFGGERHVERDVVGFSVEPVEGDEFDAEIGGGLRINERVVG